MSIIYAFLLYLAHISRHTKNEQQKKWTNKCTIQCKSYCVIEKKEKRSKRRRKSKRKINGRFLGTKTFLAFLHSFFHLISAGNSLCVYVCVCACECVMFAQSSVRRKMKYQKQKTQKKETSTHRTHTHACLHASMQCIRYPVGQFVTITISCSSDFFPIYCCSAVSYTHFFHKCVIHLCFIRTHSHSFCNFVSWWRWNLKTTTSVWLMQT